LLTNKYLDGIPDLSRAGKEDGTYLEERVQQYLPALRALNTIAEGRGQTLAQMAISWVLRQPAVTSALIGASRTEQIADILACLNAAPFSDEELKAIDAACAV
jgi:L-glyceraldehyde 3-phosphate reductase